LKRHHLKREYIPDNLEDFQFVLEKIFGFGAHVIEKAIMENLYSRLILNNKEICLKYKNKEQFNFIYYIKDLRSICLNGGRTVISNSFVYS